MNERFRWSPAFATGFGLIDGQHQALVNLINEAAPVLAAPESASMTKLDGLLDEFFGYAELHFADEEALMAARGLDESFVAAHMRQHRDFERELATMRESTPHDKTASIVVLRFLTNWLAFHILGTDQLMAEQIRLVTAGADPRDAHRRACERHDATVLRPLLDALAAHYETESRPHPGRSPADAAESVESALIARTEELARDKEALAALIKKMELTQSQLLQSEKMASIGQLAAGVAHEINNPVGFVNSNLGSLKTYVEQLLEVIDTYIGLESLLPQDPALHQRLAELKQRTDLAYLRKDILDLLHESQDGLGRIKRIVGDLKDFSHVGELDWQDADINTGLESTLNVVWNELKYKAEVIRNFGELPPVCCLAAQLNQVFMNLLVNAAQAIERRGTITITTRQEGTDVIVEIADTGKGIPQEVQSHIFEPFFTTKPVGKGTGLGLSIAWDIVRKHRGDIRVASAVGEGTTFTLRIPVAGGADQAAPAAGAPGTDAIRPSAA